MMSTTALTMKMTTLQETIIREQKDWRRNLKRREQMTGVLCRMGVQQQWQQPVLAGAGAAVAARLPQ
jgi:hypothetical protein